MASSITFAQQKPIFAVQPTTARWLYYYNYWIPYDSSVTGYSFGETKLINGSDTTPVNLTLSIKTDSVFHGSTSRGAHTELASLSRTDTFTIPTSGKLSFWRYLINSNIRPLSSPDSTANARMGWDITDTVQFLVQLVRASDNTVLTTLDSVWSGPKTSYSMADPRHGTQPQLDYVTRTLPNSYSGTTAYVMISPSWWGSITCNCCSSVVGIPFKISRCAVNASAMYDSVGNYKVTDSSWSVWSNMKYAQIISYCDSVKSAVGCLPLSPPIGFDSTAQVMRYYQRYNMVEVTDTSGYTYWRDTSCHNTSGSFGKLIVYKKGRSRIAIQNPKLGKTVEIVSVRPGSDEMSINMSVNASSFVPGVSVAIASLDGKYVGRAWNGDLTMGSNSFVVSLPKVASDAYMIIMIGSDGKILGTSKIIISK